MTAATKRKIAKIHKELMQRLELYRNEYFSNEEIRKEMRSLAHEVLAKHLGPRARKNVYVALSLDDHNTVTVRYQDLGEHTS